MDPRILRVRPMRPGGAPPGSPALRVRQSMPARRAFGDIPGPNGGPGNPVSPYDETTMWGTDGPGGTAVLTAPPDIGAVSGPAPSYVCPSIPYGESDRPWYNPTTYASIPIPAASNGTVALLNLNYGRNSLIIQNNSTATAPDVAPTLYIGFNTTPQIGQSLALLPGLGFYWGASDCAPRDTIYVLFGPSAGGTVVIAGVAIQGTYAPPSPPA